MKNAEFILVNRILRPMCLMCTQQHRSRLICIPQICTASRGCTRVSHLTDLASPYSNAGVRGVQEAVYSARADAGHHGWFELDLPCTPERLRMACPDHLSAPFAAHDIRPKLSC